MRPVAIGAWLLMLVAQAPPADPIAFDVVSIKPTVPPPTSPGGVPLAVSGALFFRSGRFRAPWATANVLVSTAYGVKDSRIVGGPDWMATAQYEILATTSDPRIQIATVERIAPLLRALLEDRFGLKAHMEHRPFPVYALVTARKDGRPGPQLRPSTSTGGCDSFGKCVTSTGVLLWPGVTMTSLADMLTKYAERPVIDRTDLTGKFDVDRQWARGRRLGTGVNAPIDPTPDSDGPSLFSAIQEQLGLKLEPRQEPIDVLIVDHIERPTAN